ncbi:MAG: hypothetical protein CO125_04660 [Hydrogenophilales bacterium CG_4_9_14_3_um_filter_59_35]|nr:MAG: hypothetical protein COW70_15070 [Hydrogenophilales bacterium CG18_big_fil_WC_8_21_14_2_50_58_12]PJB07578.1 MAG: hypothetical protein CO125_04660 [Hydrogenophilales bacterium CG_4_9_14_3_um_filter_59_35]
MFKLILLILSVGWGYLYFQQPGPLSSAQAVAQSIQNSIPSPQQVGAAIAGKLSANAPVLAAPLPKIPTLPAIQKTESGAASCGQPDADGNLKYCF